MMSRRIIYFLCLFHLGAESQSTLKQLHILFRHGERAPLKTYPNDPHRNHTWPRGWDNLNNNGILQMYNLGVRVRNEYEGFIPKYYWHKDVNVSSSYADRCKMSAEALCAGLFPPEEEQIWNENLLWQPIPISYTIRSEDIMIAAKAACPKYDRIFDEVMSSEKVESILRENQNLLSFLTEHTGEPVETLSSVETLYNTLQIEQINNLTLPTWVNDTILARMRQLGAQNLALYTETVFMKRIKGGPFLRYVLSSMEKIVEGVEVPRLNLYAGHDITLVHVLRSLNVVDTVKPDFGAHILLELYSDGAVKMIYRNSWDGSSEPIDWSSIPSNLSDLVKSLESVLPNNWKEDCKLI